MFKNFIEILKKLFMINGSDKYWNRTKWIFLGKMPSDDAKRKKAKDLKRQ